MLARWPIRVKLLFALVMLAAIVGTLAFSGFWGLYGYRQLAVTVSERAAELPLSSKLTRSADELRDSCYRIRQGARSGTSLIAADALGSLRQYDDDRFHTALSTYRTSLALYRDQFERSREDGSLFSDQSEQLAVLDQLGKQLDRIDDPAHARLTQLSSGELESLLHELNLLVEGTERLPKLLQERMAGFRNQVKGEYRTMIALAWSSLAAATLILATLLWLFRRMVVKPFRSLLAGSRLVARGDLDHRIHLGTGDEFAELAQAMNHMTDRFQKTYDELEAVCRNLDQEVRDRTREVVQREQLASVGFLAAGVAHEINNPLASIAWSAEALESRLHDLLHAEVNVASEPPEVTAEQVDSLKNNLRRIQQEAFRCKGITERLLDFSRLGDVRKSPTDLNELVQDVVAMVGTLGQYRCKSIQITTSEPVFADVNPQQIKQVVLNLLTNALESVDKDGQVEVQVSAHGENAQIIVRDNGCGMNGEVLENLFEPFFTRRRDGRGTGLGLSITYRIVNQHGGQLTAHSDGPGCGSSLQATFPLKASADVEQKNTAFAA